MTTVLEVRNLGKKYLISHKQDNHYKSLRDVMTNKSKEAIALFNIFKENTKQKNNSMEEFWALKDINFEINQGDKVGIIGRNGAGKSTLLKLLSRITEPTKGTISYNGKIASLLEVGTGFHPELTGRENVYLNGAILGMKKAEIRKQFDEIVAFAEVENFLDTPVKRYSSGMGVRLAFAVAAHINTDILIVDEVLAVGDAKFQKKSLEKMDSISKSGRTLLFVSHNMGAISQLCDKGILLQNGTIAYQGEVGETISQYNNINERNTVDINQLNTTKDKKVELKEIKIYDSKVKEKSSFDIAEKINIRLDYEVKEKLNGLQMAVTFYRNGIPIFHSYNTDDMETKLFESRPGRHVSTLTINQMFLKPGVYTVRCTAGTPDELIFDMQDIVNFSVEELSVNTVHMGWRNDRIGGVILQGQWENENA